MANYKFIYNPITKQLDLVNSDSGGGTTPLKLGNYSGFTRYVKYTDNPVVGQSVSGQVSFFSSISGLTSDIEEL